MTDKELKRLSRVELIDIIYELQKQKDAADVRVAQLQEKLNQRELRIAQAGSIAEAAIGLNGVLRLHKPRQINTCILFRQLHPAFSTNWMLRKHSGKRLFPVLKKKQIALSVRVKTRREPLSRRRRDSRLKNGIALKNAQGNSLPHTRNCRGSLREADNR